MANKKPFFLKRWLDALYKWLFNKNIPAESQDSALSPIWLSMLVAIACGFAAGMANLILKGDAEETWMAVAFVVAGVAALGFSVYCLIKTQQYVEGTGKKVFRAVFMILVNLLFALMGFILGYYLVILVIILVVLWIVLKVAFPGSNGSKTITLDDGTVLTVHYGPTGEEILEGNDGYTYHRNNDGSYSK